MHLLCVDDEIIAAPQSSGSNVVSNKETLVDFAVKRVVANGADLLVDSSTEIAKMFGVPDTVIGLTLVALGTSLPELATTVMAALRKQADVALGNVIGSNMFNLLQTFPNYFQ